MLHSGINTYTSGSVTVDISTYGGTIVPGLDPYDPLYDFDIVKNRGCTHISPCSSIAGEDYTAYPSSTLTFLDGESFKTVTINIVRFENILN